MIASQVGGHLWWRRWAPQCEVSAGFVLWEEDDTPDDWVDQPKDVAAEVALWSTGRFKWRGIEYSVSWTDDDESRRVRDDVLGLGAPDP